MRKKTESMNATMSLKTNYRCFNNVIVDLAYSIDRHIRGSLDKLEEKLTTNHSIASLYYNVKQEMKQTDMFSIEDVKTYTRFGEEHLGGFTIRLNISDCDIALKLSEWDGKVTGRLYLSGRNELLLHCPNGAFTHILSEVYSTASNLGVAA